MKNKADSENKAEMTWEETVNYFRDNLFLIGINIIDENNELIEQYQTHGRLIDITEDKIIQIKRKDDTIFRLPYDLEAIEVAQEGVYTEASTGAQITNPDFITTWEVVTQSPAENENLKKYGFYPPE